MCPNCQNTHSSFFFQSHVFNDASISSVETFILLHKDKQYIAHFVHLSFFFFTICSSSGVKKEKKKKIYDLSNTSFKPKFRQIKRNIQISFWHTHTNICSTSFKHILFLHLNHLFSLSIDKVVCVYICVCIQKNNKQIILIKHYQIYCAINFGLSFKKSTKLLFL